MLSSLPGRCRPVSVRTAVSPARSIRPSLVRSRRVSLQVCELAVADPDPVTGVQRLRPVQRLLVEVCAIRGSEVLEHQHLALAGYARVPRRGERIVQLDLGVTAAESSAAPEIVG